MYSTAKVVTQLGSLGAVLSSMAFQTRYDFKNQPSEDEFAPEPPIIPFEGDALGTAEDYALDDLGQAGDSEDVPDTGPRGCCRVQSLGRPC